MADTSVWADEEPIGLPPAILTEVLMGFRSESGFRKARDLLSDLPRLDLPDSGYVDAATLYRTPRKSGVTIRGVVDCIIAQTCIASGVERVSPDSDFEQIARYSKLRLWT